MSAFKNGDIVKTKTDIYGRVQAYRPELHPITPKEEFKIPEESAHLEYREQLPTKNPGKSGPPGSEIDEPVRIPKGKIGEVLYSDDIDTIVMFSINETGRLQPAIVKAQGFTKDFERMVRDPEKHPFIETSNPPRSLKNPQKPLKEPEKEIMGEIIDVSPTIKPFSKWKMAAKSRKKLAEEYAANHPYGDPLEWGGGHGPHAQTIAQQEDPWWKEPEDRQKLAIMNALRVAILSPMKLLRDNAIHYQDFADMDPYEPDLQKYLEKKNQLKRKWNHPGQTDIFGTEVGDYEEEKPAFGEKYPGIMDKHLKAIAELSQHVDELHKAAVEDLKQGGTGKIWREEIRNLKVSQVNDKVASFAWLLLSPKTSELATMDVHMSNALGDLDNPNKKEYETYENMLDATRHHMGYSDMPLGAFQWGVWDHYRTGPGTHQAHDAMKPLNYTPYSEVDWNPPVGKGKQLPAGFEEAQPVRDKIFEESGLKPRVKNKNNDNQLEFFSKWKKSDINNPPHPPNTSGPSMSMSEDLAHRFEWRQFEKKRRRAEKENKKQMNKKLHPNHNFFYNQGWMYMPHIFDMKNAPPQKKMHRMKQEDLDYWTQAHNTPIEWLKKDKERIEGYSLPEDSPITAELPKINRAIGWHEERLKPFLEENQRRQQGQGMNRNLFNKKRTMGKWKVK